MRAILIRQRCVQWRRDGVRLYTICHWAAGLPISIEAGIQDGHKGSVPVSHSLRAFNALAKANGVADVCFSESEINTITQDAVIPDEVAGMRSGEEARMYPVLLRRQAGARTSDDF